MNFGHEIIWKLIEDKKDRIPRKRILGGPSKIAHPKSMMTEVAESSAERL